MQGLNTGLSGHIGKPSDLSLMPTHSPTSKLLVGSYWEGGVRGVCGGDVGGVLCILCFNLGQGLEEGGGEMFVFSYSCAFILLFQLITPFH